MGYMEPIEYLRAFRRRWTLILAAVAVAVAAALLTSQVGGNVGGPTKLYRASSLIIDTARIGPTTTGTSIDDVFILSIFATTDPVAKRAAKQLEGSATAEELLAQITAEPDVESGLLKVAAIAPRPARAEAIAHAFSRALLDYAREERNTELRERIRGFTRQLRNLPPSSLIRPSIESEQSQLQSELTSPTGFRVVQDLKAEPLTAEAVLEAPTSGFGRAGAAAVAGAIGGAILVLVLERFDRRIRTKVAAEQHFDLPVLGEVPVIPRRSRRRITSLTRPQSPPAEAFRLLAAAVHQATDNGDTPDGDEHAARVIMVTSAGPAEGKTTITANLGAALAERGDRVLVLSCDMRRPALGAFLGIPEEPGLADAIRSTNGHSTLSQYKKETDVYRLSVVASGVAPSNPGEMLSSERMRTLLAEGRRKNDIVLLDTPPILVASDAAPLIPEADAVLVVACAGTTTFEVAKRVTDTLRRLGAPLVGVALNRSADMPRPAGYHPARYEVGDRTAWSSRG
jgi:capsular exopolysaccharide synthesis family protein